MEKYSAEVALASQASLGEGPLWDSQHQALWWVQILEGLLHCYDPATHSNQTHDIGQMVGTVVLRDRGGLMLALHHGFAAFDPRTETLEMIADPESAQPENRFNDGKCDPAGRFWAGTMHLDPQQHTTGALYSLDAEGQVHKRLDQIGVANGIVWTADSRTMYYVDSMRPTIDAFDFDLATGAISNRRPIYTVPETLGTADGMAIDEQDRLWVAFFGGGSVLCIEPREGTIVAQIELPVSNVTACSFGGSELDELYITTARLGLDEAQQAAEPHAGDLFVARPGIRGRDWPRYAG